jgi:hypothetical protein
MRTVQPATSGQLKVKYHPSSEVFDPLELSGLLHSNLKKIENIDLSSDTVLFCFIYLKNVTVLHVGNAHVMGTKRMERIFFLLLMKTPSRHWKVFMFSMSSCSMPIHRECRRLAKQHRQLQDSMAALYPTTHGGRRSEDTHLAYVPFIHVAGQSR